MTCLHCDHPITDHGDRAVAACAPWLPTVISAWDGHRIPRTKHCPCPGWHPASNTLEADLAPIRAAM